MVIFVVAVAVRGGSFCGRSWYGVGHGGSYGGVWWCCWRRWTLIQLLIIL